MSGIYLIRISVRSERKHFIFMLCYVWKVEKKIIVVSVAVNSRVRGITVDSYLLSQDVILFLCSIESNFTVNILFVRFNSLFH